MTPPEQVLEKAEKRLISEKGFRVLKIDGSNFVLKEGCLTDAAHNFSSKFDGSGIGSSIKFKNYDFWTGELIESGCLNWIGPKQLKSLRELQNSLGRDLSLSDMASECKKT